MKQHIIGGIIGAIISIILGWLLIGGGVVFDVVKNVSIKQIADGVIKQFEISTLSKEARDYVDVECPSDTTLISSSCTGFRDGNRHPEPAGGPVLLNNTKAACNSAITPMAVMVTVVCVRSKP